MKITAFLALCAVTATLLVAACAPPPQTNGAGQPVDPQTGTSQPGSSSSF